MGLEDMGLEDRSDGRRGGRQDQEEHEEVVQLTDAELKEFRIVVSEAGLGV